MKICILAMAEPFPVEKQEGRQETGPCWDTRERASVGITPVFSDTERMIWQQSGYSDSYQIPNRDLFGDREPVR